MPHDGNYAAAWKKTTIGNKIGAACGILSLTVSLGAVWFNHQQVSEAKSQYDLSARANHEQRLLEWQKLNKEDNAAMPDLVAYTIPTPNGPPDITRVFVEIDNDGSGIATEGGLIDVATTHVLVNISNLQPHGMPLVIGLPSSEFHRDHIMRLFFASPANSVRQKTFRFTVDHGYSPIDDRVDRQFDFLIADEPGRAPEPYDPNSGKAPPTLFGFGAANKRK